MPPDRFAIAQVTPYAWEQHHEVNTYVERVSDELCKRGHRVVVIAPSDSRELIREGRAMVKRMADDPEAVFAQEGCAQVLAVGQSLPFPPARRGPAVSLPLDGLRTVGGLMCPARAGGRGLSGYCAWRAVVARRGSGLVRVFCTGAVPPGGPALLPELMGGARGGRFPTAGSAEAGMVSAKFETDRSEHLLMA